MIFRGSQVALVAAFIVVLVVVGTVGYAWIEGWNWPDSFYMTMITITAVGYHEVHPLSETGRAFTVFMLADGLTALGAWFALITAAFVRMDLRNTYIDQATVGPGSRVTGLTLGEAGILDKTGLLVVAIHKHGQPYEDATFNPDASTRLEAGDDLIVVDDSEQVELLRAYIG